MEHSSRLLAIGLALTLIAPLAHAATISTVAALSGANENPSNVSPAAGNTVVTLDTTTHQMRVQMQFVGLTSNTTASHIHCCIAPPGNAGVATTTPAFVGFPVGVTGGSMDQTYDTTLASTWNAPFIAASGGTPLGAEAALAVGLAAGQAYLNVHTTNFPSGEIRGFLSAQTIPGTTAIPTLSTWAMGGLLVLLAGAGWLMLRRRLG